jgi:hypothetical protein
MSRDSLHNEYEELIGQLRGISPTLSIYQEIKTKIDDLKKRMGGVVGMQNLIKQTTPKQKPPRESRINIGIRKKGIWRKNFIESPEDKKVI